MAIEPHDFKKPVRLQSDVEERLIEWMRGACSTLDETCDRYFSFSISASVATAETARWSGFFPTLDETNIGWRIGFGPDDRDTLLIMRRPLALLLIDGLLGDKGDKLPGDRDLTPASDKVIKYFVEYFIRAVRENWPGGEAGHIILRQDEPSLKRQRTIQAEESIVICRFQFEGEFGEEAWYWLIPYETILKLFDSIESGEQSTQSKSERQLLEHLVGEMRAALTVRLGSIQLNSEQLKAIQVGDVLVLDQRLNAPLTARVAQQDTFHGWPGRIGSRQAVVIESMTRD